MIARIHLSLFTLVLLFSSCQPKQQAPSAESVFLTSEIMCGTVQFTDGCGEQMDTLIRFGIALIHHMTYEDAAYTFDQVMEKDPDCFWGYWGKAMTYIHPLWPDIPTDNEMEQGYVLTQKAMSLAKSEKEKAYGQAVANYYLKSDKNKLARMADMQQGWNEAAVQFPDDPEAALLNGLFRLALVPPTDKTFEVQREVGAMAEMYLTKYPDHPAAFHYGIHAYDVPPLAMKALELARHYGKVAPEIPHALHMPSHIFTRLGYWQESIDWNSRSAQAARRLPYDGHLVSPHYYHAADYMIYAMLQYGEDERAVALLQEMDTFSAKPHINPASAYALAAMPARIPLEMRDWKAAAQLENPDTSAIPWKKYPQYEAMFYESKGLGAARSGDIAMAEYNVQQLQRMQASLPETPQKKYWSDQIDVKKGIVEAWILLARGKQNDAIALMEQTATLEDNMQKNPVSPGSLLPARELLGDMYLEIGEPDKALIAYESSLTINPNRYNTYLGAAMAGDKMNQQDVAKKYYIKLTELKGSSACQRDSYKHAQKVVSEI